MRNAFGNMHETNHAIILVPYWMKERMATRNEGLNSLLVFKKATKLFSINDLAGFLALQRKMHYISGWVPSLGSSENCGNYNPPHLSDHWTMSFAFEDTEVNNLFNAISILSNSAEVNKDIDTRLFSSELNLMSLGLGLGSRDERVFETINVDTSLTYVIVTPGVFTTRYMEKNPNRMKVLEGILQVFYRAMDAHQVSRTIWFESFVKTLNEL